MPVNSTALDAFTPATFWYAVSDARPFRGQYGGSRGQLNA
jgi:hypothetical protein